MSAMRLTLIAFALSALASCGALSSLSGGSAPLDAYTLTPLTFADPGPGLGPHLVVELPTTSGALATDRILIKPTPLQAQYLPDGRWIEPVPLLVQSLLLITLQNTGNYRLVGRDGAGLMPDYTLMTEIQDFQTQPALLGGTAQTVRITALLTMIRESDRSVFSSQRISIDAAASSDESEAIVMAFESAVRSFLGEVAIWAER